MPDTKGGQEGSRCEDRASEDGHLDSHSMRTQGLGCGGVCHEGDGGRRVAPVASVTRGPGDAGQGR